VPVVFGNPCSAEPVEAQNRYVADEARNRGWPALALARPEWSGYDLERVVQSGGFRGVKVYLTYAPPGLKPSQIRIFDFLPPHQIEVIERHGWVAILHVPRPGRLADPDNVAQLLEIDRRWPQARVVIAHVGRAYCVEDLGDALKTLARTRQIRFDVSANTNEEVFARLLEAVGPQRVLFGSDMPITRMRMRRICRDGRYVNLVPRGLYGDVSGDAHMQELEEPQSRELTLFLYEELASLLRAARRVGLSDGDLQAIFGGNAERLLGLEQA
jgi:predicted TIM-barrel fold metal-dependent hydrolase